MQSFEKRHGIYEIYNEGIKICVYMPEEGIVAFSVSNLDIETLELLMEELDYLNEKYYNT